MGSPFDLSGKIALVVGGSRGIGAAIASTLAAHGADVIVTSRHAGGCANVVEEIRGRGGVAQEAVCHLGEPDQISRTISAIVIEKGRLDIVVNNGATNPYFGPAIDTDLGALQKTIDVNIRGVFLSTSYAAKKMAAGGGGSIINVASVSAIVPGPLQGIYSVTKAAIVAITKVFAAECGAMGVRVNAVLPGITETKFAAALVGDEDMLEQYLPHIPLGRVAAPSEISGAVAYLASDAASYTTGCVMVVDGGFLVR